MGDISDINARKTPGPDGFMHYTWAEVEELAVSQGDETAFCPICGDLCLCGPGSDPLHDGHAQRNNELHYEICLGLIE